MTIRTIEDLNDLLDEDFAWRRKELVDLKSLIKNASNSERKRNALLRCGVAILYAHWEGFIKFAAAAYLEYVSRQQLQYKELSPNFIAAGIKGLLSRAVQSKKAKDHNELVKFFLDRMSERSSIPYKNAINTESNLSSTTFKDIVEKLGLDYSYYATKENLIDQKLVNSRNTIAHGNYMLIDITGFDELFTEVVEMMMLFKDQIDNSVQTKAFLSAR